MCYNTMASEAGSPAPARRSGGIGRHPGLKIPWRVISVTVRPRSPAPISYRGVEQLVARRAHNPEVAGSIPVSATKMKRTPNGVLFRFGYRYCIILRPTGSRRGTSRALPVADTARRVSGSGLYFQGVIAHRRKYREPQQDAGSIPIRLCDGGGICSHYHH